MLPASLLSSYKQYKEDTFAVATWLANAAQKCGYSRDLLQKNETSEMADLNKSQKKRAKLKLKKSRQPQYLIEVNDYLGLAQFIVKTSKPLIKVSASFAQILNRVIALRRKLTIYYGGATESKNRDGHAHFLGVLEEVRSILRPRMSASLDSTIETDESAELMAEASFMNSFDALVVEEPSETKDTLTLTADVPREEESDEVSLPDGPLYGVKLDEVAEAFIAVYLLVQDLYKLRGIIRNAWLNYGMSNDGLVAASITTNTAITFANELIEDFASNYPAYANPDKFVMSYTVTTALAKGIDALSPGPGDPINFAAYNEAEECLYFSYLFLTSALDVFDWNSFPAYKKGFYGKLDMSSDRYAKTARQKFTEDKIAFMESLEDFYAYCRFSPEPLMGEDEIMRYFRPYFTSKEISLTLVFATQAWLDIGNVLRQNGTKAFQELQRTGSFVKQSITTSLGFHEKLSCPNWPKENDAVLRNIVATIDHLVTKDPFFAPKLKAVTSAKGTMSEKFAFHKQHPLFCGSLTYALKMLYNEAALTFVNAWGSVLFTAHLYNAARQEQKSAIFWPDMEWIMSRHIIHNIFVGDPPTEPDDYLKRFVLALGGSIVESTNIPLDQITNGEWKVQKKYYKRCPPDLLLDELRDQIDLENEELNFDYLAVHRSCWILLRNIKRVVHDDMIKYIGPGYLEHEYQLPFLIGYIFMTAATSKEVAKAILPVTVQGAVTSHVLHHAAMVLQANLSEEAVGAPALTLLTKLWGLEVRLRGEVWKPRGNR